MKHSKDLKGHVFPSKKFTILIVHKFIEGIGLYIGRKQQWKIKIKSALSASSIPVRDESAPRQFNKNPHHLIGQLSSQQRKTIKPYMDKNISNLGQNVDEITNHEC